MQKTGDSNATRMDKLKDMGNLVGMLKQSIGGKLRAEVNEQLAICSASHRVSKLDQALSADMTELGHVEALFEALSATKGAVATQEQLASMSDVRALLWKLLSTKVTSWSVKQVTMILDCLRMLSKVPGLAGVRPAADGPDVQDVPISVASSGMDVLSAINDITTCVETEGDMDSAMTLGIKALDGFKKTKNKQAKNTALGDQVKTWTDALLTSFEESFGKLQNMVATRGVALLADKKQVYEKLADAFQDIAKGGTDGKTGWAGAFKGTSWKDLAKHANNTLMKANGSQLDSGVTTLAQVAEKPGENNNIYIYIYITTHFLICPIARVRFRAHAHKCVVLFQPGLARGCRQEVRPSLKAELWAMPSCQTCVRGVQIHMVVAVARTAHPGDRTCQKMLCDIFHRGRSLLI
jgi:hypothetical protein